MSNCKFDGVASGNTIAAQRRRFCSTGEGSAPVAFRTEMGFPPIVAGDDLTLRGGAKLPNITNLTNTLNNVYAQAVTNWTVTPLPSISVMFPNGNITHGGSSAFAVFNTYQKKVI
jgi:hypothetical protein